MSSETRVIEIHDDFNLSVLYEKSNEQLIIIDFYTDWCGPCKKISPFYSDMSMEIEFSSVGFYKCNGENTIATREFINDVDRYPTFLFIKDMMIVDKFCGSNHDALKNKIREYL